MTRTVNHLVALGSGAIHIVRQVVAEPQNPAMLFSAEKDSTAMAHLAIRAFYPGILPFLLLYVGSTWEFRSPIEFRDAFASKHGLRLIPHANEEGRAAGINPFDHGERYTAIMRTEPLKAALDAGEYDIISGGDRRDEEKSRAKERIVSIRNAAHAWEPRQQGPEIWKLDNARLAKGHATRVLPLSNWTATDICTYALFNDIELALLYYAAPRPVAERSAPSSRSWITARWGSFLASERLSVTSASARSAAGR